VDGGQGILPYLPLNELKPAPGSGAAANPSSSASNQNATGGR